MSFSLLFRDALRAWIRPRGIGLLLAAALLPAAFTGAWVFTHQADVDVSDVSHDAGTLELNKLVNVTATFTNRLDRDAGAFNATVQVGYFENRSGVLSFRAVKEQEFNTTGLGPGQSVRFTINWTTQPGTYILRGIADVDDDLPELEEKNNERYLQVYVPFPSVRFDVPSASAPPANASRPSADVSVEGITWPKLFANQAATLQVALRNDGPGNATNATVRVRVHQATIFGYSATPARTLTATTNLTAGQSSTVDLAWTPTQVGQYALLADVQAREHSDPDPANDSLVQEAFIDREFLYEEPAPKATAKAFYRDTLQGLHLRVLIPLVALLFAAGVIEDERSRGSLAYLLTSPVPRWQIPLARFAAMAAIGVLGLAVGIMVTYFLLLGLPQDASGFFYWPLVFAAACLLAYGALFTAIGVAVRRPYLAGLVYLLGIEGALWLGRTVEVNDQPLVQDWVGKLSLTEWMVQAFQGWNPDAPGWLPEGTPAMQALGVMLLVTVGGLAAAAYLMRRREHVA